MMTTLASLRTVSPFPFPQAGIQVQARPELRNVDAVGGIVGLEVGSEHVDLGSAADFTEVAGRHLAHDGLEPTVLSRRYEVAIGGPAPGAASND